MGHFRAHERRPLRLPVQIAGARSGVERQAAVTDLSLAGAGLETEDSLVPGDRLSISFTTPTMWDPLVLSAIVAWADAPKPTADIDSLGRTRIAARSGVVFDYPDPSTTLAMFEMLATLGFE